MNLLTNYSDVNEKLYTDFFLKSEVTEYEILAKKLTQLCPTGEYMSYGWNKITKNKMIFIRDYILTSREKYFLYSDPDIIFLKKSRELLIKLLNESNCDILFQSDKHENCVSDPYNTGIFISKVNDRVFNLFQQIINYNFNDNQDDQTILNICVLDNPEIKVGFLPKTFYNYNFWRRDQKNYNELPMNWNSSINIQIPNDTVAFHANWTSGVPNKEKLLSMVRHNSL